MTTRYCLALLLCALVGAGCSAQGTESNQGGCRTASEACAQTSDCCTQYICEQNKCATPGGGADMSRGASCGNGVCEPSETMASCCADCGCPQGQACQSGACAVLADCGNGTCSGLENMMTCCLDCGCPTAQACNGQSCTASQNVSTMTWNWTSSCADGVEARLFDETLNIWWPSHSFVTHIPVGTSHLSLTCQIRRATRSASVRRTPRRG